MTTVRLLHVSDIHDKGDLKELDAIVALANETKPDAVINSGDWIDGILYRNLFIKANKEIQNILSLSDEEKALVEYQWLHHAVKNGNEEIIKNQIENLDSSPEEKEKLISAFQHYINHKDEIETAISGLETRIEKNKEKINEINKKVFNTIAKNTARADKKISGIESKVIGTRGNHETDFAYDMKSIHWLEKDGPVNIKGLVCAGAPNTYEAIIGIPEQLYSRLEKEQPISDIESFIQQFGKKEDLEAFKQNNPVYQRLTKQLKGKSADVLVTHKGLQEFAGECGYGAGLALWVKEKVIQKDAPIILCGHEHGNPFYSNEHGYEGIRASPERAYIIYIDTETKKIKEIDVYKKVYETIGTASKS